MINVGLIPMIVGLLLSTLLDENLSCLGPDDIVCGFEF